AAHRQSADRIDHAPLEPGRLGVGAPCRRREAEPDGDQSGAPTGHAHGTTRIELLRSKTRRARTTHGERGVPRVYPKDPCSPCPSVLSVLKSERLVTGYGFASVQLAPMPTSTSSGTERGNARCMTSLTSSATGSASACGASKSSSSC